VLVEVGDDSDAQPVVTSHDDAATSGRGVAMVAALATRWGVHKKVPGKAVWFLLDERQPADGS
jgi:hypothetical protein